VKIDFKSERWKRMTPLEQAAELGRDFEQLEGSLYLVAEYGADTDNRILELAALLAVLQLQVVEKLLAELERIHNPDQKPTA